MLLAIWAVVYFKVSDDAQLPDLGNVFKVVATIIIISGTYSIRSVGSGLSFHTSSTFDSIAYNNFLKFYKVGIAMVLLTLTWRPDKIIGVIPVDIKKHIYKFLEHAKFIKIPLDK